MNLQTLKSELVRQILQEEKKWYFAIVDVVEVLTESVKPGYYWYRLKKREKENGIDLSTICRQLKLASTAAASVTLVPGKKSGSFPVSATDPKFRTCVISKF